MDDHIPLESNDEEIAPPAADMAAPAPAPAAVEKLPISKKQMKKLAKMERIKEYKAERKKKEKHAKKEEAERKHAERQKQIYLMSEEEKEQMRKRQIDNRRDRQEQSQAKKARLEEAVQAGPALILDMDFDGIMLPTELVHCASQLGHSYSSNKKAEKACHLHFTGWKGDIKELAEKNITGIKNWKVTFTDKGFVEHFSDKKERLVYLTSDSQDELEELVEGDIYIIGGLVDHNRHKGLCFTRAEEAGVRHARLPIKKYVELADRAVLTINQVVQIMVEMYNQKDWKKVLDQVLPPRKRADFQSAKAEKEAEKLADKSKETEGQSNE